MMTETNSIGTMTLPSRTAVALWKTELSGQISDGMWENSNPHDHWQFWCRMNVVEGPVAKVDVVRGTGWCRKNAYAFSRLFPIVGERMLKAGRMAKVLGPNADRQTLEAGEYMPATLDEFRVCKASGKWQHEYIAPHMEKVTDEIAVAFYQSTYTMKEMRADCNLIRAAMKTVPV